MFSFQSLFPSSSSAASSSYPPQLVPFYIDPENAFVSETNSINNILHHDPSSVLGVGVPCFMPICTDHYASSMLNGNNNNNGAQYGGVTTKKPHGGGGGGKKDRHSKIFTSQGLRDRRVRLSSEIARKFFDLQDMLEYDKPSNTLEWLFTKSDNAIKELARTKHMMSSNSSSQMMLQQQQGVQDQSIIANNNNNNKKESREKARARARVRTTSKICNNNNNNCSGRRVKVNDMMMEDDIFPAIASSSVADPQIIHHPQFEAINMFNNKSREYLKPSSSLMSSHHQNHLDDEIIPNKGIISSFNNNNNEYHHHHHSISNSSSPNSPPPNWDTLSTELQIFGKSWEQ